MGKVAHEDVKAVFGKHFGSTNSVVLGIAGGDSRMLRPYHAVCQPSTVQWYVWAVLALGGLNICLSWPIRALLCRVDSMQVWSCRLPLCVHVQRAVKLLCKQAELHCIQPACQAQACSKSYPQQSFGCPQSHLR